MAGSQDDIPPPPPPPSQTPTQQTPHTVSTIKLPKLKKSSTSAVSSFLNHENQARSGSQEWTVSNVAFVSENTSSTNDVSTAYGVSNSSGHNSQYEHTSSYSLLVNQSSYSSRRDAWNTENKDKDNERRSGKQEDSKALVTIDGEGVDWTSHSEDEEDHALMAFNSNSSSNEMSVRDKAGLGYGDQFNKGVLSYENEVFQSVFVSRTSETENSSVNDRYAEGMHAVPPPMAGIYIPFGPDKEIDDSQFTYGPKQSKPSESDARSSDFNSYESNCSDETHESIPKIVVNEPTVVSQPKIWNDAPIIEEYESDSEDEHSDPSPRPSPTIPITDPIPKDSGGNLGSQSSSDKSLSGSEGGLTLQSIYDLYL
ncbi:hypothetical protein Tco_1378776 [Tanacetum coccineum]